MRYEQLPVCGLHKAQAEIEVRQQNRLSHSQGIDTWFILRAFPARTGGEGEALGEPQLPLERCLWCEWDRSLA